jgi:hypothetical protein
MIHFPRPLLYSLGALAIAMASFALVYSLRDPDRRTVAEGPIAFPSEVPSPGVGPKIEPPGPDVTPEPGMTPDTSKAFWFVPYLNQDRQKPRFVGELNGLQIDPASKGRSALEICPPTGLDLPPPGTTVEVATQLGPLQLDPARMPAGVKPVGLPGVFVCGPDVAQVYWNFEYPAGTPGVNPGGGAINVSRMRGQEPVIHAAPQDRWLATRVAGMPAVASPPIITVNNKSVGTCFVAVYDPETDVLTTVLAGESLEFCLAVAKEVVS